MKDLLYIKRKGLVESITQLFTNELDKLPYIERPIWCSDKKRKRIFIKEEDWNEDLNNEKTKTAIKNINKIQSKNINKYKEEYPDCMNNDDHKDTYIHIIKETTTPLENKLEKIIDNFIDKIHFTNEIQSSLNKDGKKYKKNKYVSDNESSESSDTDDTTDTDTTIESESNSSDSE